MQHPAIVTSSAPLPVCEIGIAAEERLKTVNLSQNIEQTPGYARIALQHMLQSCSKQRGFAAEEPGSTMEKMIAGHLKIHPTDYKHLKCPVPHVPCHCCGKKGSWYIEKPTAQQKVWPADQRNPRQYFPVITSWEWGNCCQSPHLLSTNIHHTPANIISCELSGHPISAGHTNRSSK